jgi:hypothetical protein
VRNPRDVLRELEGRPPATVTSTAALSHATAAANALGLLADREIKDTAELLGYAQAEATLAIALTLAELRTLLEKP